MICLKFKSTFILIIIVSILLSVLPTVSGEWLGDRDEADPTRADDKWLITGKEFVNATTEVWTRHIDVLAGGELIFNNAKLNFDTVTDYVYINVSAGGVMRLTNGTIFRLNNISESHGYFIEVRGQLFLDESTIMFAGYCAPTNASSCTNPTPSSTGFGPGIWINGGSVAIRNSTLGNSTYSVLLEDGSLDIANSTFENNYYGIYGYEGSDLHINGSTMRNNYYSVFLISTTDVLVTNSLFLTNLFGAYLDNSELEFDNCSFVMNRETAVSAYGGSKLVIANSVISYQWESFPGYNIFLEESSLEMTNSRSDKGMWGVYLVDCTATIEDSELVDNSFVGLFAYGSDVTVSSTILSDNDRGAVLENATGSVTSCDIVDNRLGLYILGSTPTVESNLIARNTEYGVLAQNLDFDLDESNQFRDTQGNGNGLGLFRQVNNVFLKVRDSYGNLLNYVNYSVTDSSGMVLYSGDLNVRADSRGGVLLLDQYIINREGVREVPGPYNISVRWGGDEFGGYVETSEQVAIETFGYQSVQVELPLPDLYIDDEDISISNKDLVEGDTVELTVTVHTTGHLDPAGTNLSIFINDKLEQWFILESFDGETTKSVSLKVKSEADTFTGKFRVKAVVKNYDYEQLYTMNPYNSNNTAEQWFELEDEGGGAAGLVRYFFFGLAIVIFLIVTVIVVRHMGSVSEPPKGEDEEERDSPAGPPGRRKPPAGRRPPEPPEMVRRL
jgi:hypothetical protein